MGDPEAFLFEQVFKNIEVVLCKEAGCTFEMQEFAAIWGMELARVVVDECPDIAVMHLA